MYIVAEIKAPFPKFMFFSGSKSTFETKMNVSAIELALHIKVIQ